MKNAVIYARYSSLAQNEQSIEGQLDVCKGYAAQNGYNVIGEYIDRAISGRTDDRPEFQQMISDAAQHMFDYVIVYKLDRFARNRYDSVIYKKRLKDNGVKVLSAMEGITDSPESAILEALLEGMAEYYSIDLAQKVHRGQIESIKKGRYVLGSPPYGYSLTDGKLSVCEPEAEVIRKLFGNYADGISLADCVKELNAQGYRRRNGQKFVPRSFQKTLHNRIYIGENTQKGITIKDESLRLVDNEVFDRVQERSKLNQGKGGRYVNRYNYLLTGKLYCGECRALMNGVSGTSKTGERYHYYVCANRRKNNACTKANEPAEALEKFVVDQTMSYILNPDRIEELIAEIIKAYQDSRHGSEIVRKQTRLAAIETEMAKLAERLAVVPDSAVQTVTDRMKALGDEKTTLQSELMHLKAERTLTEKDVRKWLKSLGEVDRDDPSFQAKIINIFVSAVYVWDDRAVVLYNVFSDGAAATGMTIDADVVDEEFGVHLEDATVHHRIRIVNTLLGIGFSR